jgi:carboxylesterase
MAFVSRGHGALARVGVAISHGFTGSPVSMEPWAKHLAAEGFAVSLPLLPGHGTTWQELAKTPWQHWYAAYERAYLELAADCDVVFAAGLSMGGTLALRLAAHHPVAGIAVVNPGLTFLDPRARYSGVLKYLLKSVPAIGNDTKLAGVDEQAYKRTPLAAVHQLARLFTDTTASLPQVTAPTLVFRSTEDHVVPESSIDAIRRSLGTDRLEVVPLPNSYHVATLDNDAPLIFSRSTEFFKEHSGVRRT